MGGGNGIVEYLEAGVRAASLRQAVIANNIANLDTPGFRRSAVAFEKLLAEALDSPRPPDPRTLKPEVFQPLRTPVGSNGNDVSLEMEIGELMRNSGRYKTYLRLLAKLYRQMEMAMGVPDR